MKSILGNSMPSEYICPNIEHFEELQRKINDKLKIIKSGLNNNERSIVDDQINKFKWLYGALGQVPSNVMFIAENPSITGIKHANVDTVDGEDPDIEAQWWGGTNDKAATILRPVLVDLGLKTSPPNQKRGWKCYITNVIKRANYAKFQRKITTDYRKDQEDFWADILRWEIGKVQPKVLYCLGRKTEKAVKRLIKEGSIQNIPTYYIRHYSDRGNLDDIRESMKSQLQNSRNEINMQIIRESYVPRIVDNIRIDAIALEPSAHGEQARVATRMFLTSQHPLFYDVASNLFQRLIRGIDINQINQILVIIKPDQRAYIYKLFPLSVKSITRLLKVEKYQPIYKRDIVDISSASFDDGVLDINPEENDKIIFLYRLSWNFGLYFDLTGKVDLQNTKEILGYFLKRLLYLKEYKFIENKGYYDQMIEDGWFPFVGLFGGGIDKLQAYYQDNKHHPHILEDMMNLFDRGRIERITDRWWHNQIFISKKTILLEGIDNFFDKKYASACKVFATELEGVLRVAYHKDFSEKPTTKELIEYIRDQGKKHFDSIDSLAFPDRFLDYLTKYIFQKFDVEQNDVPESRHSIAHGVAEEKIYNKNFSLKLLLTLDNIYFFFGNHFQIKSF